MLRQARKLLGFSRTLQSSFPPALASQQTRTKITYVPSPGDARPQTVTLIPGDGIGPEISEAVKEVFEALKAPVVWEQFDNVHGSDIYGNPNLEIPEEVLESITRNGVCLKGTLFTPLSANNTSTQSLNVQLRKTLDLHVNLVHGWTMPGVPSRFSDIDIVVIRENTEGEYAGLEHEVVPDVVESLKIITEEKSRRTVEYAFGYAYLNNRKKVTAVHKANIMKLSDGLFLREFNKVAKKYPSIKAEAMIVDNTCMQLVSNPQQFDVMVTPNLYGNLVMNVVAGLTGGPGLFPGVNVGENVAIFEQGARHVAKDIAGMGVANPSAALLSAAMMLRHLNLPGFSDRLERAVLNTISNEADSIKTPDIGGTGTTRSFVNSIIEKL
ncbi:isocitrate dehydrogenase, NAD-dependent [Coccomyxa subellipsoidea C-169]|uniref:Isocitrate dehydrogenase, NAD-dependent n=1 Tax=Coccomyxa subellipsoidea (strain C-169) TaxID=574566 RepID=I0YYR4_COCSC|nr:isocitrate dehydrogenase, NAD-dependent [Coccomyxa subellipsoidea C-169]EIE23533.1 isocitrate dehydrogenase, NAD-dependent [Coccomyxa subellipsoidea C-169]|eukprot:XP_005648077.1 isocitrate dehydrogenase, NAD-dependent [Coccomyxa subellipsoidea C-169]